MDIPDPIYRKLKAKAARQGNSVKELILRGVERELDQSPKKSARRITLPIIHSKRPGTINLTNEQIYEIIPFP